MRKGKAKTWMQSWRCRNAFSTHYFVTISHTV